MIGEMALHRARSRPELIKQKTPCTTVGSIRIRTQRSRLWGSTALSLLNLGEPRWQHALSAGESLGSTEGSLPAIFRSYIDQSWIFGTTNQFTSSDQTNIDSAAWFEVSLNQAPIMAMSVSIDLGQRSDWDNTAASDVETLLFGLLDQYANTPLSAEQSAATAAPIIAAATSREAPAAM